MNSCYCKFLLCFLRLTTTDDEGNGQSALSCRCSIGEICLVAIFKAFHSKLAMLCTDGNK